MEKRKKDSIYELGGMVPLRKALPPGIQHILAMLLGDVSPLTIVYDVLEVSGVLKVTLIQDAMSVAGTATLSQLYLLWKIGSGLSIVMGTSSGFIGTAKAIGVAFSYGVLMGAGLIDGIFEMVTGHSIKPLRRLLPPVVTSLVIIPVGLSLLPVGVNYFGGGDGAADFGGINHLLIGTFVIIVILIARQFEGTINNTSILTDIIAGYILATIFGMVDSTQASSASWFVLPTLISVAFEFNPQAIIAMGIMLIATIVETIGDVSGVINDGLSWEATNKELQGDVMADGLGSTPGAIFGVLSNTSFLQNVDLAAITKVVNRFAIMTDVVFLTLCGFCSRLSVLFSVMLQFVLGGVAVIIFAITLVSGIQSLTREPLGERNGLIVTLTIGLGVGIGNTPAVLVQLPSQVGNIPVQNGITAIFAIAAVLSLTPPEKKNEEEQYGDFPNWTETDQKVDPHSGMYLGVS